ncbi:MAG: CBS domain-containing protein [Lachnospiraceae bacterium]
MNIISLLHSKNTVSYLYAENTLRQGLEKMKAHGYSAIPVITNEGDYVGCISEGDFLWYLISHKEHDLHLLEHTLIQDILRPNWNPAVKIEVQIEDLMERIINQNFVPIVDDRNKFIGIITRHDIICLFRDDCFPGAN